MSERIKNIEQAIELLKPCISVIKEWKPYKFSNEEPMDYEKRCERVKKVLEKVETIINNI